ncbi:MAG: hypothetical protein N3B15_09240 [Planctomycetota bacterium]|nr:hypothetical protein [Planctomycetota bacterium]
MILERIAGGGTVAVAMPAEIGRENGPRCGEGGEGVVEYAAIGAVRMQEEQRLALAVQHRNAERRPPGQGDAQVPRPRGIQHAGRRIGDGLHRAEASGARARAATA